MLNPLTPILSSHHTNFVSYLGWEFVPKLIKWPFDERDATSLQFSVVQFYIEPYVMWILLILTRSMNCGQLHLVYKNT